MRTSLLVLGLAAVTIAVLATPVAVAQPGCTSASDSCPVEISVDETGFTQVSLLNLTVGDWHTLSISNDDTKDTGTELGQTHTVTLSGYGVSKTLEPLTVQEVVVEFSQTGCFELKDMPSGDIVKIRVVTADSIDFEQHVTPEADPCIQTVNPNPTANGGNDGTARDVSSNKGMPAVDLVAVIAGLAAVAIASRPLLRNK